MERESLLAFCIFCLVGLSAAAEREFPDWDQGVYAEINKRHGEEAARRMIDVVQFFKVAFGIENLSCLRLPGVI